MKRLFTLAYPLTIFSMLTLNGCISPKTDAFLLGAGIGAGATYYFLKGGKIDGISKKSITKESSNIIDSSIPADLEWLYFDQELPR